MPRKTTALTLVSTGPALKSGRDSAKVAKQLDSLITDAEDGLRRIVTAGLFIVEITQDLPHGQFGPWIKANLPHRSERTIFRWKGLALNILESCGLKLTQCQFSAPLHQLLALPSAKVPNDAKDFRAKVDDLIEGKTYRQLFLEFKQAEERPGEDGEIEIVPTHGGEVTPRDANGKRISARKRTKKEMDRDAFEAAADAALLFFNQSFEALMSLTGPAGEKAWDTLSNEDLEALKLNAHDLHQATLQSQFRRR